MTKLANLFYKKQNLAEKLRIVDEKFSQALSYTKWEGVEIPDEIVECIDYGRSSMSYSEFAQRMNEALARQNSESVEN